MLITRRQLIRIIKEELEFPIKGAYAQYKKGVGSFAHPDFESKDEIKHFMLKRMEDYKDVAAPDQNVQFGTGYDDYELKSGRDAKEYRRYAKVIWNKFADHEYFKNNVAKLHQVGYAGGAKKMRTTGVSRRYLAGGSAELSVVGIESKTPLLPTPEEIFTVYDPIWNIGHPGSPVPGMEIHLILDGRITWAGDFDAYTEELETHSSKVGSPDDLRRQKARELTTSSGMPKRPGGIGQLEDIESDLDEYPIILDAEDVAVMTNKKIDEMIIDNWVIKSIVLFFYVPSLSLNKNSIKKIAKRLNRERQKKKMMTYFHVLKRAVADGYPSPKICDYSAGRYWTDQEVKQLFDLLDMGAY